MNKKINQKKISVVIPCYRVKKHILSVIKSIGPEVQKIYVVDDKCPEKTGDFVKNNCQDLRVNLLFNPINRGVGGAVMTGYKRAIDDGADIIVKIDGDGQMDPSLILTFIDPIVMGLADYTKGNRFFNLEELHSMPKLRVFGNAMLSFFTKFSSGYWNIFDPTNGYTAIHSNVAKLLPFQKISNRFFFETDMLFRLYLLRAVVIDIPIKSIYSNEKSNLKIHKIIFEFLIKHLINFLKRIFYNYFLRDMSVASFELIFGFIFIFFGLSYGILNWYEYLQIGINAPSGTVMLSAMPIIIGIQFILGFISYDVHMVPTASQFKKRNF
jgi:glycosyltransferase involved in cell wall biosynthesis